MTGWHHQLNGDEFEQVPGDGEGQGSLACCSQGVAESDTTEGLNNNCRKTYLLTTRTPIPNVINLFQLL